MRWLIPLFAAMLATTAQAQALPEAQPLPEDQAALVGPPTERVQQAPTTFRLTEAQKDEILASRLETELATPADVQALNSRRPRGEVGMMVGTGGARGFYANTAVPLGENGWAAFSFENSRNSWRRGY